MQKVRHSREFWQRLVLEVAAGATVGDVATRHGVRPRTLAWWRWRLGAESAPRLLPVIVSRRNTSADVQRKGVEVVVSDVRLRIEVGADVAYVAALVDALRGAC